MKYIFFLYTLAIVSPLQAYAQESEKTTCKYPHIHSQENSARTTSKSLNNTTLLFPMIYGILSGYICRSFERHLLNDIMLFRLFNIALWSNIERSVIQDYMNDLEKKVIDHNPQALYILTRIASWVGYLNN
jgi:hypothetical protein